MLPGREALSECLHLVNQCIIMSSTDTTTNAPRPSDSPAPAPAPAQPQSLIIPQGWTNEPGHMLLDYYWTGDDDLKSELEKDYGLGDVHPLITRLPESGDVYFLFESSSVDAAGYYVWNGLSQGVYQIVEPSSLGDIYRKMDERQGALGGLEMVEVDVRAVAEEEEEEAGEEIPVNTS